MTGWREDAGVTNGEVPRSEGDVRSFFERWLTRSNGGDWSGVAEMMHADIVLTDPMRPVPARGRAEALRRARDQYEPFPDGHVAMIGDPFTALVEPELSYRWRFSGTHLRPVDPPGFAPTGRRVEVEGASVLRFHAGKVIAATLFFDTTDVARQLLAAPAAGSRAEQLVAATQRLRTRVDRLTRR